MEKIKYIKPELEELELCEDTITTSNELANIAAEEEDIWGNK